MCLLNRTVLLGLIAASSLLVTSWVVAQYIGPEIVGVATTPTHTNCTENSQQSSSKAVVNLLIDFGNGTRLWFNNTSVPISDNFYTVTGQDVHGNLGAEWYGYPLCAHFVHEILGRGCNDQAGSCRSYWSLWIWNTGKDCWKYSAAGADLVTVSSNSMVAWYFTNSDPDSFPQHCA